MCTSRSPCQYRSTLISSMRVENHACTITLITDLARSLFQRAVMISLQEGQHLPPPPYSPDAWNICLYWRQLNASVRPPNSVFPFKCHNFAVASSGTNFRLTYNIHELGCYRCTLNATGWGWGVHCMTPTKINKGLKLVSVAWHEYIGGVNGTQIGRSNRFFFQFGIDIQADH